MGTAWVSADVRPFSIKNPTGPQPTATSTVVIESLLPNPVGADEQREEVTLRNQGTSAISLAGWRLRDRSGLQWDLSGTIAAGQSTTFRRNGQAMTLNNQGDEIVLPDQSSTERDRFSYTSSSEGTLNRTLH